MIERYEDEEMAQVWSERARVSRWFRVQVANMRRVAGGELATALGNVGPPSVYRCLRWENQTRHDVVAFLFALDEKIQEADTLHTSALRQCLHYGLTSSDMTDTGMAMAVQESHRVLVRCSRDIDRAMVTWGQKLGQGNRIARTHGQLAHPVPADHHWNGLWRMHQDARRGFGRCEVPGKLSGPVGTNIEGEAEALAELGVSNCLDNTQVVPRDYLAAWVNAVAGMTAVCEAIATQVWLLAQEGIAEVREGRAQNQVGSSAMPHKRNPVTSENIRGLCRLARMNAQVLQTGVVQWGEHDLAHSSVERVALPDLCHLAATVLTRTAVLLLNLEPAETWNGNALSGTYPVGVGFQDTHAQLMELQRSGVPYVEAHAQLSSYPGGKITETANTEETA